MTWQAFQSGREVITSYFIEDHALIGLQPHIVLWVEERKFPLEIGTRAPKVHKLQKFIIIEAQSTRRIVPSKNFISGRCYEFPQRTLTCFIMSGKLWKMYSCQTCSRNAFVFNTNRHYVRVVEPLQFLEDIVSTLQGL
jgi:hypothetical protein